MMRLRAIVGGVGVLVSAQLATAQLRLATWNISFYDGTDRASAIQTSVYGLFEGRSMSPDIIAAQEFDSAAALNTFVNVLNSAPGSPGDWAAGPFVDGPDSESVLVYRTSKVTFVRQVTIALSNGTTADQPRNTYRYDVRPAGYGNVPSSTIAIYDVHLKSGAASSDNDRRLIETTHIRDNASGVNTNGSGTALPAGYQIVVCGDMNMQSSNQTSYQQLVGSLANNTGRFFDPINSPGSWNNNAAFAMIHTQDPIGAGGMDDRHDQILVGAGLLDGSGLDYIGNAAIPYSTTTWNDPNHSYRCWGNDGTSFNAALRTTGNTMVGETIALALRAVASPTGNTPAGHLPIIIDLRVPPKAGASLASIDFGTVAVGSAAPARTITISNTGNTALWTQAGIANLVYSLAASSGFTAPSGSFTDTAAVGGNNHSLTMSTATLGIKTGTLTIASNDPDQPSLIVSLSGIVTAPNQPPVAVASLPPVVNDANSNGSEPVTLDGSLSHDPDGTITNYQWKEGATTLYTGTNPAPTVILPLGSHTLTLTVTDNASATNATSATVVVNALPLANAGPDQSVTDSDNSGAETVLLDASLSTDPDGTITNYLWQEGVTTLASGTSPTASVSLGVGPHTITLTVTDNRGATAADTVLVTIQPGALCDPDLNQDGNVDQDDVAYLIDVIGGGANPTGIDPDFNADGNADQDDITALINVVAGGPCP